MSSVASAFITFALIAMALMREAFEAINAPRMAGMTDWYLANQLKNFRAGIRGGHPQDFYGKQMGFMGRNLQTDQQVQDVIAYINTL